jgi:hypothetical protein
MDIMLCATKYPQAYVDQCRSRVDQQLFAYRGLLATIPPASGTRAKKVSSAVGAFESQFFNHMLLALDDYFLHRGRTIEGKDGNPLNEVRLLCDSIKENGGVFVGQKAIAFDSTSSVLGLQPGNRINLSEADFSLLAKAFFGEIERRFV